MRRTIWGLLLVSVGILGFLQSIGVAQFGLAFWPVVLFLLGMAIFLKGLLPGPLRIRRSWIKMSLGLWVAGIGLFDILYNAGVTTQSGNDVMRLGWPLLFVGLGLSLMLGGGGRWGSLYKRRGIVGDLHYGKEPWVLDKPLHIHQLVGDIRVDLTTAEITPGKHEISVTGLVGEVHIRVPDDQSVNVVAQTGVGDVNVFNDHRDGVSIRMEKRVPVPEADATLNIHTQLRIGTVSVVRVPSSAGKAAPPTLTQPPTGTQPSSESKPSPESKPSSETQPPTEG